MSRLLSHNELEIYCSHDRSCRGHNKLWMIEENYQIIPSSHIIRHVSIWIKDLLQPVSYEFCIVMKMNNELVWVIASIGLITADLSQENSLSDVKKQGAIYGCRNCLAPKNRLTDTTFDRIRYARFHQITKEHFIELQTLINQNATKTEIEDFTKRHGIRSKPGILSTLSRDHHLQTSQDTYHAVAGKIQKLLECTFNLLNESGKRQFLKHWRYFKKPSTWHSLPNPVTHLKTFIFSDALQLTMLMPFILSSRCCGALFQVKLTQNDLNNLQNLLIEEHCTLLELFPDDFNLYINFHLIQNCKNYATLVNSNCAVKEMVHKIFKQDVLKTNRKNIEFDLMQRINVLQAIRYLIDGKTDDWFNEINVRDRLRRWYMTEDLHPENISEEGIVSEDIRIINIQVWKQLTHSEIQSLQLTNHIDDNSTLKNGLFVAYAEYMQQRKYIKIHTIKLYQYIRYMLLNDNREFYAHIKLHIDDVVIIKEEKEESYAIIRAIFTHKYNDGLIYTFVWIDWLKNIERTDALLECPIYERQGESDTRWYRIYPISILNDIPK
ncbi:33868_t:CDS:2, partial [Gigaspora margarita]